MERGRGRHRRGGGGRRRGGGRGAENEHSGRGGRGAESGHAGHGGRGETRAPKPTDEGAESREENEDISSGFSRRKILSNWDRYEKAEKEVENSVLQRGADYGVLLGSAGDSFTQFRFADERDWDTSKTSNKEATALYFDTQALARTLQVLPLHLRLNVEAELVLEELPQDLPQYKPKDTSSLTPALTRLPNICVSEALPPAEIRTTNPTKPPEDLPLDEDLDFLLNLESPIREDHDNSITVGVTSGHEDNDLEEMCAEGHPPITDITAPAKETHKALTPDDLEDWLDSMIS